MKYTKIIDAVYGRDEPFNDLRININERVAYNVIRCLEGRGGFDHWWDPIDDELKDEIFAELVKEIKTSMNTP